MKITLRKAKAIQSYIEAAIIDPSFEGSIEPFSDIQLKLNSILSNANSTIERNEYLYSVLYDIRDMLAEANHIYGVNKLLVKINKCTKLSNLYNVNGVADAEPLQVYEKRLRKQEESGDVYSNSIRVSTLSYDIKNEFLNRKGDLDRLKISLQDDLSHINNTNYIILPEKLVDILKLYNIV